MKIAYGCCVGSWEKLIQYVLPNTNSHPIITQHGQTSITTAYNAILDISAKYDIDMLILLHDDLEITDPYAEEKFWAAVSKPDIAIAGVAGGRGIASLAWWEYETVGHQTINSGLLDFGPRSGEVSTLEGSIMVFSRWAINNLRFDERFIGFHGYDEIGMQAWHHGKRVIVTDVDTHHHTNLGFKSKDDAEAWGKANVLFCEKWNLG